MSSGLLLAILTLGLVSLLLLLFSLVGSVVLLAWGSRLAFQEPEPGAQRRGERRLPASLASRTRAGRAVWPVAFMVLPGFAQVLFSLTRPTPRRFQILAWAVSLGLVAGLGLSLAFLSLAKAFGFEASS